MCMILARKPFQSAFLQRGVSVRRRWQQPHLSWAPRFAVDVPFHSRHGSIIRCNMKLSISSIHSFATSACARSDTDFAGAADSSVAFASIQWDKDAALDPYGTQLRMQYLYIHGNQSGDKRPLRSTLLWQLGNNRSSKGDSPTAPSVTSISSPNSKHTPATEEHPNNVALSPCDATAVLYLHGHNDCFFQTELKDWSLSSGMSFYAVDLPSYGRSRYENERPGASIERDGLEKYFDVLDIVIERIRNEDEHKHVILMGHSLGSLVAVHYAHREKSSSNVHALILNSPFFEIRHRYPSIVRYLLGNSLQLVGRLFPRLSIPVHEKETNISEAGHPDSSLWYGRSLHNHHSGEWSFDPKIKAIFRGPITFGWLRHILRAQHAVQSGKIHVACPVLVLTSSANGGGTWNDISYSNSDCVLFIHHMRAYSYLLASQVPFEIRKFECELELSQSHSLIASKRQFGNVRLVPIEEAIHDVILSRKEVRQQVYNEMRFWLNDTKHLIS